MISKIIVSSEIIRFIWTHTVLMLINIAISSNFYTGRHSVFQSSLSLIDSSSESVWTDRRSWIFPFSSSLLFLLCLILCENCQNQMGDSRLFCRYWIRFGRLLNQIVCFWNLILLKIFTFDLHDGCMSRFSRGSLKTSVKSFPPKALSPLFLELLCWGYGFICYLYV